jgi:hypothetical protein
LVVSNFYCITFYKDYFSGENSTYNDNDFRRRYRMRRHLFEHIRRRVEQRDPYFRQKVDRAGVRGARSYQKVTAALRMLAYATSADQLDEYIRLAESMILQTTKRFCIAVIQEFGPIYLRRPNEGDLELILKLSEKEGFNGCLGSVDVMKWEWKNCPIAWRGSYTSGKDKVPSIGLEAVVDCRLYFWHAFFGVPGAQNDINVVDQSDFFQNLVEGKAPEVHFIVNNKVYDMGYYLSDGIYPPWYVLMQSIPKPVGNKQCHFAKLQEAKRKEVERAFGVLQVHTAGCCLFLLLRCQIFLTILYLCFFSPA